jgi:hypothetical protein
MKSVWAIDARVSSHKTIVMGALAGATLLSIAMSSGLTKDYCE